MLKDKYPIRNIERIESDFSIQQILSDNEYFNQYCLSADIVHGSNLEDIIFIKDTQLKYSYVSKSYLNLLYPDKPNVKASDILGQVSAQLIGDKISYSLEQDFLSQDAEVIASNQMKCFLSINDHNRTFITSKSPIVNPATGNCVGIFCRMDKFIHPHIVSLIYKINGIDFGSADSTLIERLKYRLTQKQHMVLFYI